MDFKSPALKKTTSLEMDQDLNRQILKMLADEQEFGGRS